MIGTEKLSALKSSLVAAKMAYETGDFDQCARLYTQTIELAEQEGLDGAILPEAYIYLSVCQSARKEFKEAETLLNKALAINNSDSHCDPILLALNYHELSVLYWRTDREDRSREMNDLALAALESVRQNAAELQVMLLKHKAVLLADSKKYKEASSLLETALDICVSNRTLGKNSLAYGQTLITKVLLCVDTQNFEEAKEIYSQAIQIVEMHLGIHHPKLADLYDIFSNHTRAANEEEESEFFHKKSQALRDWINKSHKW